MPQKSKLTILRIQSTPSTSTPKVASRTFEVLEVDRGVGGVEHQQQDQHEGRQRRQEPALHPPFGRQGPDRPLDQVALADHAGQLGEQLGEVAAGLLLDEHGQDEDLQLDHAGPPGQVAEGDLGREAEVLLLVAVGELGGDRLGELVGDGQQGLAQRLAGADHPGHQLEGVGELRAELLDPRGRGTA